MVFDVNRSVQMPEHTSSKGNQNKWYKDGWWYKEDGLGYESLSEIVVSALLKKTSIEPFVSYEYAEIVHGDQKLCGCRSRDFMEESDDRVIPVERLFLAYEGEGASQALLAFRDIKERIRYVVDVVERVTGLSDFGGYLKKMLTIDAVFFNEDRHFNNIAVIQKKDGSFRECPLFDHGAALFSDIRGDYPLAMSVMDCRAKIKAKPFSTDFDEQLDLCELLYPEGEICMDFTVSDVKKLLDNWHGVYPSAILERVQETLTDQIRKYQYLFCGS